MQTDPVKQKNEAAEALLDDAYGIYAEKAQDLNISPLTRKLFDEIASSYPALEGLSAIDLANTFFGIEPQTKDNWVEETHRENLVEVRKLLENNPPFSDQFATQLCRTWHKVLSKARGVIVASVRDHAASDPTGTEACFYRLMFEKDLRFSATHIMQGADIMSTRAKAQIIDWICDEAEKEEIWGISGTIAPVTDRSSILRIINRFERNISLHRRTQMLGCFSGTPDEFTQSWMVEYLRIYKKERLASEELEGEHQPVLDIICGILSTAPKAVPVETELRRWVESAALPQCQRELAVRALHESPCGESQQLLRKLAISDKNPDIRAACARALRVLG